MIKILGIDPALRKTGWAIIEKNNNSLSFIACGTVKTNDKSSMSDRLSDLHYQLAEVIEEVKSEFIGKGIEFNTICCLLATAPLVSSNNLVEGYSILRESNADSVRPVVKFSYPIQRALKMVKGKVSFINPEFTKTRSQDLEPAFYDAGMFYWMKFESGLNGLNKYGFEISELQTQDIDNPEDWKIAELKYQILNK